MNSKVTISTTIVLFNEEEETLQKTINSFLSIPLTKKLFLIDNSPTDVLKKMANSPEIEYVFNNKNIGFGKAHNQVLKKVVSDYHLILNPDVVFDAQVIPNLIKELEKQPDVSMISPKVVYPTGEEQLICRKKPTIKEMLGRRLGIFTKTVQERSYQNNDRIKPFYPDFIHGCFMLFKTTDLKEIQGFDERYFLYLEDADICRKVYQNEKKVMFYPNEKITHIYRKGSSKKIRLLLYHLQSAIKYFRKWGFKA